MMYGVVMAYRGPQKLLKKFSKLRQRSPNFPKENKNSNDRFCDWHLNNLSFTFCACQAYHIYARGVTVEVDFRSEL